MQALTQARGFYIPPFRSSQLHEDQLFTRAVQEVRQIQTGDFLGFCEIGKRNFYGIHVGMAWVDRKQIKVVHNAKHRGFAAAEPLDEVLRHPKHARLAWIKRPVVYDSKLFNPGKLQELGFAFLVPSYSPPATTNSALIVGYGS